MYRNQEQKFKIFIATSYCCNIQVHNPFSVSLILMVLDKSTIPQPVRNYSPTLHSPNLKTSSCHRWSEKRTVLSNSSPQEIQSPNSQLSFSHYWFLFVVKGLKTAKPHASVGTVVTLCCSGVCEICFPLVSFSSQSSQAVLVPSVEGDDDELRVKLLSARSSPLPASFSSCDLSTFPPFNKSRPFLLSFPCPVPSFPSNPNLTGRPSGVFFRSQKNESELRHPQSRSRKDFFLCIVIFPFFSVYCYFLHVVSYVSNKKKKTQLVIQFDDSRGN